MVTTESLFQGRIKLRQKQKGYRFTTDSVILAYHVPLADGNTAVDLGTGCGVIPLILSYRFPCVRFVGIELQEDLVRLAQENVHLNGMAQQISIVQGDMRNIASYIAPGSADVVFSNPPYGRARGGRVSPDRERAVARQEVEACLSDVLSAAQKTLKVSGKVCIIYPAARSVDLVSQMRAFGLEPKQLRWVHSTVESTAELVYVQGIKDGKPGIEVVPPLFVHESDGRFTIEMERMMGDETVKRET